MRICFVFNVNKVCFDASPGCDMCADNRNGECPMHGPLHSLRRLVGTSGSAAPVTLPDVPDWLRDLPREVRRPLPAELYFEI